MSDDTLYKPIDEFLLYLHRLNIKLWDDDGYLGYSAPEGILTPQLLEQMRVRKVEILDFLRQTQQESVLSPIPLAPRDKPLPLSFAQRRLWFLDQLEGPNAIYNISGALKFSGPLNISALQHSLTITVQRHEVLRTTFQNRNGQIHQIISAKATVIIPLINLQALPVEVQRIEVQRLAQEEAQRPFNLSRDLMLRFQLLQLNAAEHVLLLTMHHIASDGWSLAILARELGTLYKAFIQRQPAELPPLKIQYTDYVYWQQQRLQDKLQVAHLDYWQKQLTDAPPVLDLPTDYPRPTIQTFRGDQVQFTLPPALVEHLRQLSQQANATLFMTLLAAFKVLLARYSGQTDIVVGSPIANRTHLDIEPLIGFFVNTLVLRSDLSDNPTFSQLLDQVRDVTQGAYEHQDLPFEQLVEALKPERHLSHTPLFQVMFVLQNTPKISLALPHLHVNLLEIEPTTAKFDLSLELEETEQGLTGRWVYNPDLFKPETIERMASHFQTLLTAVVADPKQYVLNLRLLTVTDRQKLVVTWNNTQIDYPKNKCAHQLFETQADQTPDAIALMFEDQHLTYHGLNIRANQLAHYLQDLGVAPETRVGVYLERSVDLIITIYAIFKAGGVLVPLEPAYPTERLAFILEDAQVSLVIGHSSVVSDHTSMAFNKALETTDNGQKSIIHLDTNWANIACHNGENPDNQVTVENLAYLIYTSGSTGNPKGVMVEHQHLLNTLLGSQTTFSFANDDIMPCLASFSFDISLFELFNPHLAGGTALLLSKQAILDIPNLVRTLRNVTAVHAVPSLMQQIGHYLATSATEPPLDNLRQIFTGGDTVPPTLLNELGPIFPQTQITVLYGPTEATIICSAYPVPPQQPVQAHLIGRPLPNVLLRVADQFGQLVPIGVPGELLIGGAGVSRGYLDRDKLTQEKYIIIDGQRYYRSGDQVRWLAEGQLEFLGRVDHQVKIRGFRVELGEIEATLNRHPDVIESVVVDREDRPGHKRLVAYVVSSGQYSMDSGQSTVNSEQSTVDSKQGAVISNQTNEKLLTDNRLLFTDLRRFLQAKLPDYMVPAVFIALDTLPLNPNGKVDRRALPAPEPTAPGLDYVPPNTPAETTLAEIWAEILGVEQVGRHDNFFDMGGHSLLATQAISRMRQIFQIDLPLRTLFEYPTIETLAKEMAQAKQTTMFAIEPVPRPENEALSLSFSQQRLWFLDQLEGPNPTYNFPVVLKLSGVLDISALSGSLNEIVQRHESLRTTFQSINGEPGQIIQTNVKLALSLIDLQHLPDEVQPIEIGRLAKIEALYPFNLSQDLMLRVKLVLLRQNEYILLTTLHHIASDGWSIGVLIQEITTLYQAYTQGLPSPLPTFSIQYADFAHWQRRQLQDKFLEIHLAYWQQQFTPMPSILSLPTDHPRPAQMIGHGGHLAFALPASLSRKLQALSNQAGATLYMTLLAAFKVLLYRYTGQTDVVIGSPIANRTQPELEPLIGFFVNTLVLRTNLSGNPTFLELLGQVKQVTQGAYQHQALPFEMLVETLQPERNLGHIPLFQIEFVWQNEVQPQLELPGLEVCLVENDFSLARFDLTLAMEWDSQERLTGKLVFNSTLFETETIERIVGHFQTLLTDLVDNPRQPIDQVSMLTDTERHQQLIAWNDTQLQYPRYNCLHLFEAQVERTPDAVAVFFEDQGLTYQELNRRANQLARHLQSLSVDPEALVGICVDRSLEMTIGILAILKTGAAYVPLDPTYPTGRLAYMLDNAQVSLLLTQSTLHSRVVEIQAAATAELSTIIGLDTVWPQISSYSGANLTTTVSPDNLAYIIYTSGSTGRPKGIALSHRALANLIHWQLAYTTCPGPVRMLQFSPLSFDASFVDMFMTWGAGGCLVLIPEQLRYESSLLADFIIAQTIERLNLPYVAFHQLAVMFEIRGVWPHKLKEIFSTGEQLQITGAIRQLMTHVPGCRLQNQYGPSETHVVTALTLNTSVQEWPILPAIGQPIANNQLCILDRYFEPVPIGVTGDLYIGGVNLARGYIRQPALTAAKFIPNPFGKGRLYRTGDMARFLADGNIEFLGRMDHQVKMRGFRIELGEIEAVLSQHPDVVEAVVVVGQNPTGDDWLVAYVVGGQWAVDSDQWTVGSEQSAVDSDQDSVISNQTNDKLFTDNRSLFTDLRRFLQAKLPNHMIPSAFVSLDTLPLTPNGKVDRRSLPAPDLSNQDLAIYVPPQTPTQELMAAIWADILNLEQIGIHDNFFELGGHSLIATQVVVRIRDMFQIELPLRDLFEQPTIAQLAHRVTLAQKPARPPIQPVNRTDMLPLSFAQQRLWFLDQLEGPSATYNNPGTVRLTGALNIRALQQSFAEIIRRHESLRTTFSTVDGQAQQTIQPASTFILPVIDLQHLPPIEQTQRITALARAEAHQSFNLSSDLMLRAMLVQQRQDDFMLLVTMHHIASDGWSLGVLIQEVSELYAAFSWGRPSPLPELAVQYVDFALWQRNWFQGEVLQEQLTYWQQQLAHLPALLELPTDRPRPPVQTFRGRHLPVLIPQPLTQALQQLSLKSQTTLFMTLLAAFKVLLMRYSGQTDIAVGSPIANRTQYEIENLIGFFVNTLVLRSDLGDNPSFKELLSQIRQTTLEAYRHQDMPFEMLVEALQPERSLSQSPLFQVMFVLQNAPGEMIDLPEITLTRLTTDQVTAKFNLGLIINETEQGLEGTWEYNTDLFDLTTIERMARHFQQLLAGIIDNPNQPIAHLPLLTEVERRQLLVEWNNTQTDYPHDHCVHHLFESQSAKTPEATALIFGDQHFTYEELNNRANQLAHTLQTLDLPPEARIGVYLKRSVDLIVSIYAIFKVGAVFVPLDPAYPAQRLAFMINDAQAALIISDTSLPDPTTEVSGANGLDHILMIYLDTQAAQINQAPTHNPESKVAPTQLAYLIYTSGSTGQPKGVMVEHGHLLSTLWASQAAFNFSDDEIMPCIASFSFDIALFELFNPHLAGGTARLLPKQEILNLPGLIQILRNVTSFHTVPSLMQQIVQYLTELTSDKPLDNIRQVFTGGDAVPPTLLANLPIICPQAQVIVLYGPTEATIICSAYPVAAHSHAIDHHIIGRPLPNVHLRVVDNEQQLVPIGVPGELLIGGFGVSRGYLGHPQLTNEKFISLDGQRFYCSGDRVRWLAEGYLEFLGRIDHQVKIRGFRVELGEIETILNQHPHVQDCIALVREDHPGHQQIVAYVVQSQLSAYNEHSTVNSEQYSVIGNQANTKLLTGNRLLFTDNRSLLTDLRRFLQTKLPDYMIPNHFIVLDALPLTPNGKVDRRALPTPKRIQAPTHDPPRSLTEEILATIWSNLLGVEPVGVHDNFFELGGDSIISLQVIARANQNGLRLTAKQMFQYQTIAELASIADTTSVHQIDQGQVIGPIPMTPVQYWFFEQPLTTYHHFNQAILVEVPANFKPAILWPAIKHLVNHHDALRIRFERKGDIWQQINTASDGLVPCAAFDLSHLSIKAQPAALETVATTLQASLNISTGPLLRVAWFKLGSSQTGRLLFIIHHLVVDGVSWRILLEDMQTIYQQLAQNKPVILPSKTTSFKIWAERLTQYAQSESLTKEQTYWLSLDRPAQPWIKLKPLPLDYPSGKANNLIASTAIIQVELDVDQTQALLKDVPPVYNTKINDVLLTTLLQTLIPWTQGDTLLIDLEGHGREELFEAVDISRTVGWFTSIFPALLTLDPAHRSQPGETLKSVKEQLSCIPHQGIGYGLLRYISQDEAIQTNFESLHQAEMVFNYLGQTDQVLSGSTLFSRAYEATGPAQSLVETRPYVLEITGVVAEGKLHMTWKYSQNIHKSTTIEALAFDFMANLQALIAHCQQPDAGGYTPSDFPDIEFKQAELDRVLSQIDFAHSLADRRIDDIYPLSPSQQGMLFETLSIPASGVHIEQQVWTVQGEVSVDAIRQSVQNVLDHHPILRTAFVWQDQIELLQAVLQRVGSPVSELDWQDIPLNQQQEQLKAYLEAERRQGFDLTQAPLLRLTLLRLGPNHYTLVWTTHHILMDGWSQTRILREITLFLAALSQGQEPDLVSSRPYRDYIRWLRQQDLSQAANFWQQQLAGFNQPTPLGIEDDRNVVIDNEAGYGYQSVKLSSSLTAKLQSLVQSHHLTMNTLIQGVWALFLSRYSRRPDVIFGATVSGRPADLIGVESIIGLFINTVPIRIKVAPSETLWPWLTSLREQYLQQQKYEYCSAGQIRQWADIPGSNRLYDSILVFQNYPVPVSPHLEQTFNLSETYAVGAQTRYALTILVTLDDALTIRIIFDHSRFAAADIDQILNHFLTVLESVGNMPNPALKILMDKIPTDQIPNVRPNAGHKQLGQAFVAPRDMLELQLAQLWEEILDIRPIGVKDYFLELGASSLMAAQLLAHIQQQFGQHLSLATLLQSPTIESLAAFLRQGPNPDQWSPLVTIQANGTKPPFFCIPGAGSNPLYLYHLARHLDPEQPFYSLQASGLDGVTAPVTTIEAMAAHYIEAIQNVQPEGPYYLGGHSFGGKVAFEMAQQLMRQGQDVALLAIFDSSPFFEGKSEIPATNEVQWLTNFAAMVEEFTGETLSITNEILNSLGPEEQLQYLKQRLEQVNVLPSETDVKQLRGQIEVFKANYQALSSYIRRKVPSIPVALFCPSDNPEAENETTLEDWSTIGPVDFHEVPGTHITMTAEPHVQVLAEMLANCLNKTPHRDHRPPLPGESRS